MSVLDLAAASRTTGNGYITLATLEVFPQYVDSDGYTRALAERSSDGAIMVVYVRGAHAGIVDTFNERAKLTHERSQATAEFSALVEHWSPAEVPADDPDAIAYGQTIAACDESLSTLPRVRAQATLQVARALTHYERADTAEVPADDSDTDSE